MKKKLLQRIFFIGLFFSVSDAFAQTPSPYYISDIFRRMYSRHEYFDSLTPAEYNHRIKLIEDSISNAYSKLMQWKSDSLALVSLKQTTEIKIEDSTSSFKMDSVILEDIMHARAVQDSLNQINSIGEKKKKKKQEIVVSNSDTSFTDMQRMDSIIAVDLFVDSLSVMTADSFSIPQQWLLMDTASQKTAEGKNTEAIFYYDKVIGNYPGTEEYETAFYFRAQCKMALNDFENALFDINKFIQMDSCSLRYCSSSLYDRGMINFMLKKYEPAVSDFSVVVKDSIFNNQKFCYFYRALCNGELNKPIQAVQDFTRFLTMDSYKTVSSAEALYYRGFYKSKLEDNRGAITDYDLAIELYTAALNSTKDKKVIYLQKLIDTYIIRGHAYSEIKKYQEAIMNYNTVIKMKPDYAEAYHLKGLAEIEKGEVDAGCLDLSKAGELGSNDAYNDIKIHCK